MTEEQIIRYVMKSPENTNEAVLRSMMDQMAAPQPAPSTQAKEVVFIDYDGTVLYSYTKNEALALNSLPPNPTHSGLISQGWNYTLEQIKHGINTVGACTIGQMYITDDGKTRIYNKIYDTSKLFYINVHVDSQSSSYDEYVVIDWGDNTEPTVVNAIDPDIWWSRLSHQYSEVGEYCVTISSPEEYEYDIDFYKDNYYNDMTSAVHFGEHVKYIDESAFSFCYALKSAIIPDSVTSIEDNAFYNCYALSSITIPSSFTSISNYTFDECLALKTVAIPSSVTSIGDNAFHYCTALESIVIPSSVASIGYEAFYGCSSLKAITIPSSVTIISYGAFGDCYTLSSITIPSSVTSIGGEAFYGCYSLKAITIPSSVTSIGDDAFYYCSALESIVIPSSAADIGNTVFYACYSLRSVTFESGAGRGSIGESIFSYCSSLSKIIMESGIPPWYGQALTLGYNNMYSAYTIYVPYGCGDNYIYSDYWSSNAAHIVEMDPPGPEFAYTTVDTATTGDLDKTWNEISTLLDEGKVVIILLPDTSYSACVTGVDVSRDPGDPDPESPANYWVYTNHLPSYICNAPDHYPTVWDP